MVSPGAGSGTSGRGQAGPGDGNLRSSLGLCEERLQPLPALAGDRGLPFHSAAQKVEMRCLTEPPLGVQGKACSLNGATVPWNSSRMPSVRQEAALKRV